MSYETHRPNWEREQADGLADDVSCGETSVSERREVSPEARRVIAEARAERDALKASLAASKEQAELAAARQATQEAVETAGV